MATSLSEFLKDEFDMMMTEFSFADWLLFVSLCSMLIAFSGFIVFIIRECVKGEGFTLMTLVLYFLGFFIKHITAWSNHYNNELFVL